MVFTATWFAGHKIISSQEGGNFADTCSMARSKLVALKVRSGATHVEVRSEDGALLFGSSAGMVPACERRPTMAAQFVKRWRMPNSSFALIDAM
jgi:hypothetical protein